MQMRGTDDSETTARHEIARQAVGRDPTDAEAWNTLGLVLAERGALAESAEAFLGAVRINATSVEAINNLAVILQRLDRLGEAETWFLKALALAPDNLDIPFNFALLQCKLGRYRDALATLDALIAKAPVAAAPRVVAAELEQELGDDLAALGRLDQALFAVLAAAAAGPADGPSTTADECLILTRRAHVRFRLGRARAALADCDFILSRLPNDPEALHMRAIALQGLDRVADALDAFRAAEAVSAAPAKVMTNRAVLLAEIGEKEAALALLDEALQSRPKLADAWYMRTKLKRYAPGDPDLRVMEAMADAPETPFRDRLQLMYGLGKVYLDMDDGARAFARLDAGARLKRASLNYDPAADAAFFDEIMAIYTGETLAGLAGHGHPTARPIFVFGMPRSGTTLVEQILASHARVRGAGEPTYLADLAETGGLWSRVATSPIPDFARCGEDYLGLIAPDSLPDGVHIVDKAPLNFLYAGLIRLILPNARMIHCRRDPLDTCLSCYSLLFTRGQEYSYDQAELGRFYRLYERIMAHWRDVLPADRLLDIDYESLAGGDTEAQIRRLLDFCGLDWDPACLRFHETRRRVTSSSMNQVRSPLYSDSIGRGRLFSPWLGPLEAALSERL